MRSIAFGLGKGFHWDPYTDLRFHRLSAVKRVMAHSDESSLSFAVSGGSSPTEPILSLMDAPPNVSTVPESTSPDHPPSESSGIVIVPPSVPKIKGFPPSLPGPGPVVRRLDTPTSGSSASKRGKSADSGVVGRSPSPLVALDTPKRRSSSARTASSGDGKVKKKEKKDKEARLKEKVSSLERKLTQATIDHTVAVTGVAYDYEQERQAQLKSYMEHSDAQEARAAQDRMRADIEISKLQDKAMRLLSLIHI